MSAELISESQPRAMKIHGCRACEAILEAGLKQFVRQIPFSEKRIVAKARQDNWDIQIGEIYLDQVCKYDGDIYHFRSKIDMDILVRKYDYYPES